MAGRPPTTTQKPHTTHGTRTQSTGIHRQENHQTAQNVRSITARTLFTLRPHNPPRRPIRHRSPHPHQSRRRRTIRKQHVSGTRVLQSQSRTSNRTTQQSQTTQPRQQTKTMVTTCQHCDRPVHARQLCQHHYNQQHYINRRAPHVKPTPHLTPEQRAIRDQAKADRAATRQQKHAGLTLEQRREKHRETRRLYKLRMYGNTDRQRDW